MKIQKVLATTLSLLDGEDGLIGSDHHPPLVTMKRKALISKPLKKLMSADTPSSGFQST